VTAGTASITTAMASLLALGSLRVIAAQTPSAGLALPVTIGVEIVESTCLRCHEADLILSQRLSQAGWDREIAKMERWGAMLAAGERPALLAYLTREFGLRPVPSHDSPSIAASEAIFQNACFACHGDDLPAQQRLTAAGWGREVDKMVRWGARVSSGDKPALVAYLTSRWGYP
jgi:mono/diheme cytochrome c family protein